MESPHVFFAYTLVPRESNITFLLTFDLLELTRPRDGPIY
jgi:hypothetical protein